MLSLAGVVLAASMTVGQVDEETTPVAVPYQKWIRQWEGSWDVTFAHGVQMKTQIQLVAKGHAALILDDTDGVGVVGWHPDSKTLVATVYSPNGA